MTDLKQVINAPVKKHCSVWCAPVIFYLVLMIIVLIIRIWLGVIILKNFKNANVDKQVYMFMFLPLAFDIPFLIILMIICYYSKDAKTGYCKTGWAWAFLIIGSIILSLITTFVHNSTLKNAEQQIQNLNNSHNI